VSLRSRLNTFRLRALSLSGGTDQSLNRFSASPVNERYNPTAVSAHEAISMRTRRCAPPCPISEKSEITVITNGTSNAKRGQLFLRRAASQTK